MEDAATAEICRSQIWQWIRRPQGALDDGRKVTIELFQQLLGEELERIKGAVGAQRYAAGRYEQAAELFESLTTSDEFTEFLTIPGYQNLD
jgi:malate synthase